MENQPNTKKNKKISKNTVRTRVMQQIQHMADHAVIKNRRFLDNEQLIISEQISVLEEIFNDNVREEEIRELSLHFSGILRGDYPCHLAIWGKCGTGKTLSTLFFLKIFSEQFGKHIWQVFNSTTPSPHSKAKRQVHYMDTKPQNQGKMENPGMKKAL